MSYIVHTLESILAGPAAVAVTPTIGRSLAVIAVAVTDQAGAKVNSLRAEASLDLREVLPVVTAEQAEILAAVGVVIDTVEAEHGMFHLRARLRSAHCSTGVVVYLDPTEAARMIAAGFASLASTPQTEGAAQQGMTRGQAVQAMESLAPGQPGAVLGIQR